MSPEKPEDPQQDPTASAPDEEARVEVEAAEATAKADAKAARKPARKRRAAKAKQDAGEAPAEEPASEKAPAPKAGAGKRSRAKKAPAAKEPAPKAAEPVAERRPAARSRSGSKADGQAPRRSVVRAHARYVRTSARKARMVCGHLRGKSVQEARAILAFTPREVARDWSKLLESAVANAESNHELLEDDLIVREAFADEGPTIKRFRPRAMGRATPIRKRTSHLTITLTPSPEPGTTKRRG
jgi:ribosomal protein L22